MSATQSHAALVDALRGAQLGPDALNCEELRKLVAVSDLSDVTRARLYMWLADQL